MPLYNILVANKVQRFDKVLAKIGLNCAQLFRHGVVVVLTSIPDTAVRLRY